MSRAKGVAPVAHVVAREVAATRIREAGLGEPADTAASSLKGRLIPRTWMKGRAFNDSLEAALAAEQANLDDLPVESLTALRSLIIRAARRSEGTKLTVYRWLGTCFEIAGPTAPWVNGLFSGLADDFAALVNEFLRSPGAPGKPPAMMFRDGRRELVTVSSPFKTASTITDVRLRVRGSDGPGVEWVDRMDLRGNLENQQLAVTVEGKARGASGDLRRQVGSRDERLEEFRGTDAEITFLRNGKRETLPLEQLIFVEGAIDPYSKIGFRAGKTYDWRVAMDSAGKPYLRIVVPYNTDLLRRILHRLHSDPSWQRPSEPP
jgi:hypothetical protein